MRASMEGDAQAYHRLLCGITPHLRAVTYRILYNAGANVNETEDVVQEVLLALHLKRSTWDSTRPLRPWLSAIVRNKTIDILRRRGRHMSVPIDDVMDYLAAEDQTVEAVKRLDITNAVNRLQGAQKEIVRSISVEGTSVREAAMQLNMSEGAVRVALHRALKTLSGLCRSEVSEDG
ncbi:hypothetical protein N185_16970 [Sinorhizobium sp. GW3]|nr:hypothetical protein N185_16970 [Sinorhizobium sp. GW3]